MRIIICTVLTLLVAACSGSNKQKTLGQLEYAPEKEPEVAVSQMDYTQVRNEYKELADLFEDKQLKEQIERRIADVYMMEGVQNQANDVNIHKSHYLEAIQSYREFLQKYPDSPDNAEVLYQLAKAYDMEGKTDDALRMLETLTRHHPYYGNLSEAWFRMGDIYFGQQRYSNAEHAYAQVAQSQASKFTTNAYYMLGWTLYKQGQFEQSVNALAYVMDTLLPGTTDIESLNPGLRTMVEDTLHSISLAVDRMGGAESIKNLAIFKGKPYVWMLYENLGDHYLEKEFYEYSAESFREFVTLYPQSDKAPRLHKKLVDTYLNGGFPSQAIAEKESYVKAYGVYSKYAGNQQGIRKDIKPILKTYLEELAQHNHASGQDLIASAAKNRKAKKSAKKIARLEADATLLFDKAADFYQQFIKTFPADARVDEMRFLRAEVLFEAKRYEDAIPDYELVAYAPVGSSAKQHAANSGYAAIVSYEKVIAAKAADSEDKSHWQSKAVQSMLRFSEKFDNDKRSPAVLTSAADYMFSLDQYQRAIEIGSSLITNNAGLDKGVKKTAYGIIAHSWFKLQNYVEAEKAYTLQRNLTEQGSEEYLAISNRLAAAIYKHSEVLANSDDKAAAADSFLRIKTLAPNSSIRSTAQYDAVVMLMSLKQWNRVIPELKELKSNYSHHELAAEFPRKLAYAYEQSEQWQLAADEYLALSANDPEAEVKREALFLSASMYEKNKNHTTAIELFKRYAYTYEKPFDTRMEARYHLATNYESIGEIGKKLYWLRRIIDGDKKGGAQRTERSRWLGAWANMEYGNYFAEEFNKTSLRLPLIKSLPRKNEKLQSALQRYQSAADYGFLDFVTESSFKIGRLYQTFARELRKSPIPSGMAKKDITLYKTIIEEQAAPFEQLAIEVHMANISRAWSGEFNKWISQSFDAMRVLSPARFNKDELVVSYGDEIR